MSLIAGFLAGIFGGLVGLGGGVIMIPIMVDFLKANQHTAHGTSLVAIIFTGLAGALTYWLHGSVDWVASVLLAATAMVTAQYGARFAGALPEWKLKKSFGAFLLVVSALMLVKPYLPHFAPDAFSQWVQVVILLSSGALTGFLSGMMGVGGGTIMVPAMVLLLGFSQQTAQGSSLGDGARRGRRGLYRSAPRQRQSGTPHGPGPGHPGRTYVGGSIANMLPGMQLRHFCSRAHLHGSVTEDPGRRRRLAPRMNAIARQIKYHGHDKALPTLVYTGFCLRCQVLPG